MKQGIWEKAEVDVLAVFAGEPSAVHNGPRAGGQGVWFAANSLVRRGDRRQTVDFAIASPRNIAALGATHESPAFPRVHSLALRVCKLRRMLTAVLSSAMAGNGGFRSELAEMLEPAIWGLLFFRDLSERTVFSSARLTSVVSGLRKADTSQQETLLWWWNW